MLQLLKKSSTNKAKKAAPAKKLAYDMTDEELDAEVDANVKRQLAPKRPEPVEKIDPATVKKCLENLRRPTAEEVLPDYDHSIMKSRESHVQRARASGKKVPHFGEHENQSCPPLNVFSDIPYDSDCTKLIREMAGELGLSMAEYLGSIQEYHPMSEFAYKYQYGKPLVRPEEVPKLPTKMRRLYQWYMAETKKGTN